MHLRTNFFLHVLIWAGGHVAASHDIPLRCSLEECANKVSLVLMQVTLKKNLKNLSPVMDADADFIEDANDPLEKEVSALEDTETESSATPNNNTNTETNSSGNETGNAKDNLIGSTNVTHNTTNVTNLSTCITREDPRVSSTFYITSPVGTPCVFGVDPRDEGSHCIMEAGKYGSFGWCYTSKSRQSWGSCSESCPLFGPSKVLGAKINKIDSELGDRVRAELKKVLAGPTQENTTTVPTHGQTTAAPAASGNKSGNATGNASGKADDANDDDTGNAKKKTSGNAVGKGKKAANGTGSLKRTKHDGHDTQE